ncbi:MAG: ABC transporter ATP-binding protein [Deltaproteobacteria bacterium]|nr:ABC transporter ATP-binding protein [Deltaproteobacteria bacterium]
MPDQGFFDIRNLSFAYGQHRALSDVTVSLRAGCFHGLVGPNGSGKTTLLDTLLGLKKPGQGQVLINGRSVFDLPRRELACRLALVPQEFAINFAFTVREVVLMGRYPYQRRLAGPTAADLRMVDRALELMDITDMANQIVTELSSGEKQRVAIARALAQDTSALLLDEPTSNLDVSHAHRVLQVAADLATKGRTIVAVLHDLNLAAAFCQELVLLKGGHLQAAGPTGLVLTSEHIRTAFRVEAAVEMNHYSERLAVSFKY